MPIYEYECRSCDRVFEIWQKLSDPPQSECPQCSGPLTKLVSLSSFQLKGGGWYADGYSHRSESKEPKADGATAKEPKPKESKSSTGGENKGSEKTSAKSSDTKPKKSAT